LRYAGGSRVIAQIQPFQGKWSTTVNMQAFADQQRKAEAASEEQAKRWVAIWAAREMERIKTELGVR
jgi:hypothetical protein